MGTGEVRNLYGFDGGNRIGEGRRPKLNLTCAVELPGGFKFELQHWLQQASSLPFQV